MLKISQRRLLPLIIGILLWAVSLWVGARSLRPDEIPPALQPWVNWAIYDHEDYSCPTYYNEETQICRWPSQLDLSVNTTKAQFKQIWQVYSAGWITLPGDKKNWPQLVYVNEKLALVADHNDGLPMVWVSPGSITVQGEFEWKQRPEYLPVPIDTGLVKLTIDNTSVPIPALDEQGRLWLRQGGVASGNDTAEENRLDLRVYRLILDEIPLQMLTRLELDVAGKHREVVIGPAMLEQQIAMSLESPLPARLEPDGRLRIQVRPGTYVLTLRTRQPGATPQLTLPVTEVGPWVAEEVWAFQARNDLRFVEITGVTAIDPQQTTLPEAWRNFPAYQVHPGETMELSEKLRGDPNSTPDQLTLTRQWWLDFDGKGYSVQDWVTGKMTQGWRLEMAMPAVLGRVTMNDQDQFITRLAANGNSGVEVRRGRLELVADSRLEEATQQLPAVGWTHDFQSVNATLHLPPGWRLFSAIGVDEIPDTWLKQWTLLDLFIVLILAGATGRLWGKRWGLLMLVMALLTYHEIGAPRWVWLNIIAAMALLRVLPEISKFSRLVRMYRNLSLFSLLVIAIPFMMQQARQSLFPQLERSWIGLEMPDYSSYNDYRYQQRNIVSGMTSEEAGMGEMAQQESMDKYAESNMNEPSPRATQPAAPPPVPQMQKMEKRYQSFSFSKSGKVAAKLAQIDPNAKVQTGPGLPQWQWTNIQMRWNGPVEQAQEIQLWLLSPLVNGILGGIRIILLSAMMVFFLWRAWSKPARTWLKQIPPLVPVPSTAVTTTTAILLLILVGGWSWSALLYAQDSSTPTMIENQNETNTSGEPSPAVVANSPNSVISAPESTPLPALVTALFPSTELLEELKNRLLAPPDCLPSCASNSRMKLELDAEQLKIRLEVHSYTEMAIPLPGTAKQWLAQSVMLDGQPAAGLFRTSEGKLWLKVNEGIHQILLEGPLPNRNTVQLPLPLKPHLVEINAKGWQVEGLREDGLAEDQLQFTREQTTSRLTALEMGSLPPFVQIERTLLLGLDWQVVTRVLRLTPTGAAVVLEIPLLPGESVTSEQVRVVGNKALINLSPSESEIAWTSIFSKQDTIQLTAPNNTFSNEVWRLDASAIWHVKVEGIPVIHHQNDEGRWFPEWRPWPGESVTLHLTRPEGVTGQVLTIDRSQLTVTPGLRATDNTLSLTLRSSRGGQHTLTLPENAQLQSIHINGSSQPIRQEGHKVTFPITPGEQQVVLTFRQSQGLTSYLVTPRLELGLPSVNTHLQVNMPRERWILFLGGTPVGPAVMFWGIFIVIVLGALGLSQVPLTPLKFHHWLLLGIVISQLHIVLVLCVVGWLLALGWRAQLPADLPTLRFNLIQLGLAVLTLLALGILIAAIDQGLLRHPQMYIAGNGSEASSLRWYEDRTAGVLPQVWVFSWSVWIYRLAMLLWALWLAFALMRWLRWGWECFSTHGWWKSFSLTKTKD